MQKYYCRWAESLGPLENTAKEIWGTEDYVYPKHKNEPTVFFGLYDTRDYLALWRHKGKKYILWAGSDIDNLRDGFMFNNGKLKWLSLIFRGRFRKWLIKTIRSAENWVETKNEWDKLLKIGVVSQMCPSFMGKFEDFPLCYKQSDKPNVFVSSHQGREDEYGFSFIWELAKEVPECVFHLYGSDICLEGENVICHGRVSREQFNKEIKDYQCGLRLNKSDGFSEITCKSILLGQYPITHLKNDMIPNFKTKDELVEMLKALKDMKEPNIEGREYYKIILNKYSWNTKLA